MTVKKQKYSGNERPTSRDWQNFFAEGRFRYIEVLFHLFYYILRQRKFFLLPSSSLYRGSLYPGCIEKKMKIRKMREGVNLAARGGRTFLKENLLVLKTKKSKVFQYF